MITATSKMVKKLVLAVSEELPVMIPPAGEACKETSLGQAYKSAAPIALEMMLQLAVTDIGQLTYIAR